MVVDSNLKEVKKQIEDNDYKWYVLSVISWQENLVVENLKERVKKQWLEEDIVDFMVPIVPQKVINKRSGKISIKQKKLYPWYVFVKSKMNDKIWYVIRNTPWVRLIVWAETTPIPLTDKEYNDILNKIKQAQEKIEHSTVLKEGDIVIIRGWEFEWLEWVISEVDLNRWIAYVNVEILGRVTPVVVSFEKLELKE